jgi:hypothetical protein
MNVDLNIFKNAEYMIENYLYIKNKQLKLLVSDYKEVSGVYPFKGARTVENN